MQLKTGMMSTLYTYSLIYATVLGGIILGSFRANICRELTISHKRYTWYMSHMVVHREIICDRRDLRTAYVYSPRSNVLPLLLPLQVTLFAYVNVACKRIFDVIPKQVHHFLVVGTCDGLEDWMLNNVTSEDLEKWFVEDSQSQRKRKDMMRKVAQFKEGIEILRATRYSS